MGIDLSDVPAITSAPGLSFATYVALASLLFWLLIVTLFWPTDDVWLRIFTIMLLTVFLAFGGYALISSATVVHEAASKAAAEEASRLVDGPLRLVVGGAPTDDARVRDALLLAVAWDRLPASVAEVDFVQSLTDLTAARRAYDHKRARQLLAEAGHPNGVPIAPRLGDHATAPEVRSLEALAAAWRAIGTTSTMRGPGGTAAASIVTVDILSYR